MNRPVTILKGVGEQVTKKLSGLDIHTLADLLFHLPCDYQDRTRLTPIRNLRHGHFALVQGVIIDNKTLWGRFRRMRLTLREGEDSGHRLHMTYFHFSSKMKATFSVGTRLRCFGKVRMNARGEAEMAHPECTFVSKDSPLPLEASLTPVYPLTAGISQRQIRGMIHTALNELGKQRLPNLLPEHTEPSLSDSLMKICQTDLTEALHIMHYPPPQIDISVLLDRLHPAQCRLALEELTAYRLALLKEKNSRVKLTAPPLVSPEELWQKLKNSLPFELTAGQQKSLTEIRADLEQPHPMTRLVQGDVGCGKTLVAAFAALQSIASGYQVALMAPTEILAQQHLARFDEWFGALNIRVVPLLGRMTAKAKQVNGLEIADGTAQMIIGTHALFQESVQFAKLGLCIIDEQHRFGVEQRFLLHKKGEALHPHQLLMTATPIPRTLAQTLFANMDVSSIKDLPPGRLPCSTVPLSSEKRPQLIERIRKQIAKGVQVYWVCPLIEESEILNAEAAEKMAVHLRKAMPEVKIDLVHGRCHADTKRTAMADFHSGKTELLVATTVIEVGVDVPNANFMVIENAERLGLSQLHQLRGRVGRGHQASYCVLCYQEPISPQAKQRLQLMCKCSSGFEIAEADMKWRGTGEILGTKQSGMPEFKIANPAIHHSLSSAVVTLSEKMLQDSPENQAALINRWLKRKKQYGAI